MRNNDTNNESRKQMSNSDIQLTFFELSTGDTISFEKNNRYKNDPTYFVWLNEEKKIGSVRLYQQGWVYSLDVKNLRRTSWFITNDDLGYCVSRLYNFFLEMEPIKNDLLAMFN